MRILLSELLRLAGADDTRIEQALVFVGLLIHVVLAKKVRVELGGERRPIERGTLTELAAKTPMSSDALMMVEHPLARGEFKIVVNALTHDARHERVLDLLFFEDRRLGASERCLSRARSSIQEDRDARHCPTRQKIYIIFWEGGREKEKEGEDKGRGKEKVRTFFRLGESGRQTGARRRSSQTQKLEEIKNIQGGKEEIWRAFSPIEVSSFMAVCRELHYELTPQGRARLDNVSSAPASLLELIAWMAAFTAYTSNNGQTTFWRVHCHGVATLGVRNQLPHVLQAAMLLRDMPILAILEAQGREWIRLVRS